MYIVVMLLQQSVLNAALQQRSFMNRLVALWLGQMSIG
jgi:hypothetical protein